MIKSPCYWRGLFLPILPPDPLLHIFTACKAHLRHEASNKKYVAQAKGRFQK